MMNQPPNTGSVVTVLQNNSQNRAQLLQQLISAVNNVTNQVQALTKAVS